MEVTETSKNKPSNKNNNPSQNKPGSSKSNNSEENSKSNFNKIIIVYKNCEPISKVEFDKQIFDHKKGAKYHRFRYNELKKDFLLFQQVLRTTTSL